MASSWSKSWAVACGQGGAGLLKPIRVAAHEDQVGAFVGGQLGHASADAGGSADDHQGAVFQTVHDT
jgi:hypothetical protein